MGNEQKYNISTSKNDGIVEIIFTGEIIRDSMQKLIDEVNAILKPMNTKKLLWDIREFKMPREYVEVYQRVRNYPAPLRVKTAVVDLAEHADFESFHETTSRNAGISMKCFTDIDEARKWLEM